MTLKSESEIEDEQYLKDGVNTKWNLEERTAKFGAEIIRFSRKIPRDSVTFRRIPQLVAAGTSIGANYCEADDACAHAFAGGQGTSFDF